MRLSIVVPVYNEVDNVSLIISEFGKIQKNRRDVEIILIDGCSNDGTQDKLSRELKKRKSKIKLLTTKRRNGYGADIITGLKKATGDILSWTHADIQTDPKDVIKAFDLYKKNAKDKIFVKGKRKNRKLLETFFTFGMQMVSFFVLREYIDDINAQPKMFSREFYETYLKKGAPNDFSLDLYALYQAKRNGYKILEIPVVFAKRLYGEAKGGGSWKTRIKLIKRTFRYIFELEKKIK